MRKIFSLLIVFAFATIQAFGQMSDEEIIQYVMEGQAAGKGQQEIATELLQRGVTMEQLQNIKKNYEDGEIDINSYKQGSNGTGTDDRSRQAMQEVVQPVVKERPFYINPVSGEKVYTDGEQADIAVNKSKIFGKDIFNNTLLTFEPRLNIATPENYTLGPGDEVIIDIWGDAENSIAKTISPDGTIMVDRVGLIHLGGISVKEANRRVKSVFEERSYSGIRTGNVQIKLTLGSIRSVQVNVMGEVSTPGTYTLPSLATAFHALYQAGGVNDIGSLRSIKIYRQGKIISTIDIYEYIFNGKDQNIILQDGDVIIVSPYINLVEITGKVKRPMYYELLEVETMQKLLEYAGGFRGDAYKAGVRVIRKSEKEYEVYNIEEEEYTHFTLADGDVVTVDSVLSRYANKLEIRGAVYRPGMYAFNKNLNTVKKLIARADGLREDAFLNRAVLYRENADLTFSAESVDISGIMKGSVQDIFLRKNDVLHIPSIFDLQEELFITVKGAVGKPGVYKYVKNMDVEDIVIQSGGLLESASTIKVDVARRIKDPKSTTIGELRAETYTLTIQDGLIISGPSDFTFQPFDEIYFRRSPGYQEQRDVFVEGEVMFHGEYALARKGERISDLVQRAGGLTSEAYPEGARLMRKTTPEEKKLVLETLKKLNEANQNQRIDIDESIADYYPIGIELQKALKEPGSDFDIILKEGDRIVIPEYNGTVTISGAVMYPNTVVYKPNKKKSFYIAQAGGYVQRAKKRKAFVVYMNGTVSIARGTKTIQPGCEIIVPLKANRKGFGLPEILGIANSATSMAAMVASIVSLTK